MIYVTQCMACPVGCGLGLIFLKAVGTDRIFFFCHGCGVAYAEPPMERVHSVTSWERWEHFAPNGITLPSREDIEQAGRGSAIDAENPESKYYKACLWQLFARTAIQEGDLKRAVAILDDAIATWHCPPDEARSMRSEAIRVLAAGNV